MSDFHEIPHIDWAALITLLRSTYTYRDGGLPGESGIDGGVITDGYVGGVHSLKNGRILWNLAVAKLREGRITEDQLRACVIDEPERLAG